MSSSPNPEDLRKAACAKLEKAQKDFDKTKQMLDKLKESKIESKSKARHETKLRQASGDIEAAKEEIRKLDVQESSKATEPPSHEPEPALGDGGLATADLAPSILAKGHAEVSVSVGPETITQLRQELATVREDLNRERADRERENKERDRQFAAVQEAFTKFLATVQSEKNERVKSYEPDLSGYKQTLRDDYKEAVKEIQDQAQMDRHADLTQAQVDREEDLSTHRELLGQIKSFQSEIGILKKSVASLQSDTSSYGRNISSLQAHSRDDRADYLQLKNDIRERMREIKDEVRDTDANRLTKVKDAANDVLALKLEVDSVKKNIATLQEQSKGSLLGKDAPPPKPDADYLLRLDFLEAFQTSATKTLNGMGGDLMMAKNGLDVMQDACSRVAYDAAKEEAEAVAARLTSRIDAIASRVNPNDDINAVSLRLTSRIDAIENKVVFGDDLEAISTSLTSRIDAMKHKFIPDEDVRARLSTCETELTKVVKWVGQRPDDDPDDKTLTGMVSTLELDLVGHPDSEGILTIVDRCEGAVRRCEDTVEATVTEWNTKIDDAVAKLGQPKPEGVVLDSDQAAIDNKISSLETKLESQRFVFEGQVKTSFNNLEHKVNALDSQLPPLRNEIQQEKAAREKLENRVTAITQSSLGSNHAKLRADIEAIKPSVLSTGDRTRVLEVGLRNLEVRYNAITTTSLVQKMLDQIHNLLPPDKDLVTVIRNVSQHADQIRELREEVNGLPNKLSLNNDIGMNDVGSLNQTVETFKQTVDEKAKDMESQQQAILRKLNALQAQLGLDSDELYSDGNLRESMESSMKELHAGLEQIKLTVSSVVQGRITETGAKGVQETMQSIGADLALLKDVQGKLEARIDHLDEEAGKASTVSASDQTRLAKQQHFGELRHTVQQHGLRIDQLEANTKNTIAGANDSITVTDFGSEDGPPSVPRRKPTPPSPVSAEGSSKRKSHANRDRTKSSGSNKKSRTLRSRSRSSMSIVQDSEEEER